LGISTVPLSELFLTVQDHREIFEVVVVRETLAGMPSAPIVKATELARKAIVCNLQNEQYVPNTLVLGYTIRKHNPNLGDETDLVLLVPLDHDMTNTSLTRLQEVGWKIRPEPNLAVNGAENLQPNYRRNFMKLIIWSWIEYRKVALIDADCMCMGDISLWISENFGASPLLSKLILEFGAVQDTVSRIMRAENFNTGVLSLVPSLPKFEYLLQALTEMPVEKDAEQGFLNHIYSLPPKTYNNSVYLRTELPQTYNLNLQAYKSWRSDWDKLWPDARVVHFTVHKPWPRKMGNKDLGFEEAMDAWDDAWEEMIQKYNWVVDWDAMKTPPY